MILLSTYTPAEETPMQSTRGILEAAVFIETIPYFETREYVKNVLANMQTYSMLTGEPIKNFTGFLGKVTPSLAEAKDLP